MELADDLGDHAAAGTPGPCPWAARAAVTAGVASLVLGLAAGAVWTIADTTLTR